MRLDRHEPQLTHVERLVDDLTDGAADGFLAVDLEGWMATSGAFEPFVTTHRDKIRQSAA